jgi:hypothetical protein
MASRKMKKKASRKAVRASGSRVGIGGGFDFKPGSFAPTPAPMNAPPPAVPTTPYSSLEGYFKKPPVVETYENMARRELTARREPKPNLPTEINDTGRFIVHNNTEQWLKNQESQEEQKGKPSLKEQIEERAPYFKKLDEIKNKKLPAPAKSSLANVFSKFYPFASKNSVGKMPLTSTPVGKHFSREGGRRRTKRNKRKMRGTRRL